ncbi:MAG: gfo/Idh/MocA family oxidoreductase, partial [Paludibacteraceae bacterium]|nr:gfo/Idh/MocA family oxidoreductase [Paludibacteraceae bacterium]
FIGNPKTNGCREIMAIDLPWIVTAFGAIRDVKVMKSKNTELNIQYNDNYFVMIQHESGAKGVFAVDVVARKPYRHIDVYGESLQLSWNGTADSLIQFDIENKQDINISFTDASEHVDGYAAFITENPYREELNSYLRQIEDKEYQPAWNFEKDKVVLGWIDKIEA